MKKVIENKKALKLEENDYYQYQKYEKMKMSLNDVTPDKMEKGIYKKILLLQRPGGGIAQDQQDDSTHLHQGDGEQDHFP